MRAKDNDESSREDVSLMVVLRRVERSICMSCSCCCNVSIISCNIKTGKSGVDLDSDNYREGTRRHYSNQKASSSIRIEAVCHVYVHSKHSRSLQQSLPHSVCNSAAQLSGG